ncbi:sulfotransferase family protein [Bacillus cereus]|uniref:sulfotransferase family protein n=1 Tax=Bacillus cereus group sp. BfR-BA-01399 TaxID=2920333 RepID=UPI001F5AF329|nr:sulfotransferase family protein [Bacillus cereus]MDA2267018.1 sulfotransferase family protein [Bacillus cereus]MDC7775177.1 sulfotransferase family protein [Bacillus cereus]
MYLIRKNSISSISNGGTVLNGTKNSKLFLILSAHRSGSSAAAGVLHTLGIHMGDYLLKPSVTNPKGYFENIHFVNLNDQILNLVNTTWDNPPIRENTKYPIELLQDIISFINTQTKPVWGLKDPRICLTFDIWKTPLECLADVTYIFSWRPLQESVLSLIHRDKINKQRAFDILNQYHKNLIFYRQQLEYENKDIIDIHFHELLENPKKFVKQINIRMDRKENYNIDKVISFLDGKLKHY